MRLTALKILATHVLGGGTPFDHDRANAQDSHRGLIKSALETYLPRSATASEIDAAIDTAIRETNASSTRDVGIVMKAAMRGLSGKTADGRAVNQRVREKLGA